MASAPTSTSALDTADRQVDPLLLVRLVRRRRRLRRTGFLALLAAPCWIGAVIAVQEQNPSSSDLWQLADDTANPVLLALAGIGALGLLAMLAIGWSHRPEARMAARLVPLLSRAASLAATGDTRRGAALVALLDRRPRAEFGVVVWLVCSLLFSGVMVSQVGTVWRANHGEGGPRYTVGEDAFLSRTDSSGRGTNYWVYTPEGEFISQSGRPHDGEQFVVAGNSAYQVGGYTWLLIVCLLLVGVGSAVAAALVLRSTWRTEAARRRAHGRPDIADALDQARDGRPLYLSISDQPRALVTFAPLGDEPAGAVVSRYRRRAAVTGAAGLLAVAAVAVVALELAPPRDRDAQIDELADVGGQRVSLSYEQDQNMESLFASLAGAPPAGHWEAALYELPGSDAYANLDVFELPDGLAAEQAQEGIADFLLEPYDTPVEPLPAGLVPAGWTAVLGGAPGDRATDFVVARGDHLVWGTVRSGEGTTDRQLLEHTETLMTDIAGMGVEEFVDRTGP